MKSELVVKASLFNVSRLKVWICLQCDDLPTDPMLGHIPVGTFLTIPYVS
jgi:hypothetical protein